MEAEPQIWRERATSRDPRDIADPANAPYLYTDGNGEKFIDWYNSNHQLEKWAERLALLGQGSEEEKREYFRQYYYSRLSHKFQLGPKDEEARARQFALKIVALPERRPASNTDEVLQALRALKQHLARLIRQRNILAQVASRTGCPGGANPDCALQAFPPDHRDPASCSQCWVRYAEGTQI